MAVAEHVRRMLVELAHAKLPQIKPHLELVEGGAEIVPGIRANPASGHSLGHLALSIPAGAPVLHLSDTVLNPVLMERPDWTSPFDLLADKVV
jgi:glyoxylase-like metal-dependent hydrolase (beta-lactamase superfamily II)